MWYISSVFIFLLLNFLTIKTTAKVIWAENFNTPNKGVWGDADGKNLHTDFSEIERWMINYDSCYFTSEKDYVKTVSTAGGRLEALDCDGEAIWYSPWIIIGEYESVRCELTARETGSGSKAEKKYLKAYYQLNQQDEVVFETNGISEANWSLATVSQANLRGDSIRIIVRMNSSYAADKVILDDVRITTNQSDLVDLNQLAEPGDLLITEVLFNPYLDGLDFVELYNQSDKNIRLDHLFLANRDDDELKNQVQLTAGEYLFPAHSYLVLSENADRVLAFYETKCADCFYDLEKMPAFNNDDGDVVLLNDSFEVIDEMHYSYKMHHYLIVDEEGVSLERKSFSVLGTDENNWVSAAASVGFATPGYKNSMNRNTTVEHDQIILEPKSFSPNDDGYNDYLSITYQFENPNYVANLKIFDSHGQLVCDLVKNELAGNEGEWIWFGKRNNGQRNSLGIYIVLLELYDDRGIVKQFKKVCSITDRLE